MTVRYTQKVANQRGFGSFAGLLLRWRGSVYKMVWQDMLAYTTLYFLISFVYRFALGDDQKRIFESIVLSCARFRTAIPLSFVLGFYVSLTVNRWWGTYMSMPWPDATALLLATHVQGQDGVAKEIRSTVIRYVNLSIAITFSMVAPSVKRKYPNWDSFVMAGYLTDAEKNIIIDLDQRIKTHKATIPLMWASKVVEKARQEGHMLSDTVMNNTINEINVVRRNCCQILGWNEHNIPLVYTQVVTIAVYIFFCSSLLGEQFLDPQQKYDNHMIDLYIPWSALLQLFFYVGWVKVAEALLNPFGDDDHDFELVPFLERDWEMSKMLGEPQPNEIPPAITNMGENLLATENKQFSMVTTPNSKSKENIDYIDSNP